VADSDGRAGAELTSLETLPAGRPTARLPGPLWQQTAFTLGLIKRRTPLALTCASRASPKSVSIVCTKRSPDATSTRTTASALAEVLLLLGFAEVHERAMAMGVQRALVAGRLPPR
jgi:hypothetical protein